MASVYSSFRFGKCKLLQITFRCPHFYNFPMQIASKGESLRWLLYLNIEICQRIIRFDFGFCTQHRWLVWATASIDCLSVSDWYTQFAMHNLIPAVLRRTSGLSPWSNAAQAHKLILFWCSSNLNTCFLLQQHSDCNFQSVRVPETKLDDRHAIRSPLPYVGRL